MFGDETSVHLALSINVAVLLYLKDFLTSLGTPLLEFLPQNKVYPLPLHISTAFHQCDWNEFL